MKMVEYRVVSCIGQIIIDNDTALFLVGNFQSGLFPLIRFDSRSAGPIQKSGLPEVEVFSPLILISCQMPESQGIC
jgi:hypothetical protein